MPKKDNVKNIYSLSPMQEGILFHVLMEDNSGVYVEQAVIVMKGAVEPDLFERAFQQLVKRHDILRTVFVYKTTKRPRQVVLKEQEAPFDFTDVEDISLSTGETPDDYIETFIKQDRKRGFDLTGGPLMRLHLFKIGKSLCRLVWSFHHILIDGWCLDILYFEFMQLYRAAQTGISPGLEPVTPYSHYIRWLEKQDKQKGLDYWKSFLEGYEQSASLPRFNGSSGTGQYTSGNYRLQVDQSLTEQLRRAAVKNQVTENIFFQVLWGILLQRYVDTDDVVFGAVVAGRPAEIVGVERMVGLFVNTVPVRIKFRDGAGDTFSGLLKKVQRQSALSKPYEYLSLAEVQSGSPLKNRLIDHIMAFQNISRETHGKQTGGGNGGKAEIISQNLGIREQTNYDLNLLVEPSSRLSVEFMFNRAVYEPEFIERVARQLNRIIRQAAAEPGIPVKDIDILSPEEKHKLLVDFNETASRWPKDKTIHRLFEEQVEQTPNRIALRDRKAEVRKEKGTRAGMHLTYRELNIKSDRLARVFIEKGIRPGIIVGIMTEPSLDMVAAILGILKSGGAYLPIDPEYPAAHINYMLSDSRAKILLTTKNSAKTINFDIETIYLDSPGASFNSHRSSVINHDSKNPAYIIYTSGSTGKPKGVMVEHCGVVNYTKWAEAFYLKGERCDFPLYSSIAFDLTVTSIYVPLLSGNAVVLYRGGDGEFVISGILREGLVQALKLTPTHLGMLKFGNGKYRGIGRLIVGGEDLTTKLAGETHRFFEDNVEIYNEYGPTEATVGCMIYKYNPVADRGKSVPIGIPVTNTKIYILAENGSPVPVLIPGELCISGEGLARGYLNRPELTAEKFIPHPWITGEFMYRTGDRARHLPDGNVEFLGRIDQQVKIRGFRIEPGEIEYKLSRHDDISNAVVIVKEDENGNKNLCAYIVSKREPTASELREYLVRQLPDYMIPSYFVHLEKIPVTANGKINRSALPDPVGRGLRDNADYIPPKNDVEVTLVEIWGQVLGRKSIGINENFFLIGGDSIKSIQIMSRMNSAGYKLRMKDLFKYPLISELAPHVTKLKYIPNQSVITGTIPLTPIQEMFFSESHIAPFHFNQAVMLYSSEGFDREITREVFLKIQEHHDALRMTYKKDADSGRVFQVNHGLDYPLSIDEYDLKNRENSIEELRAKVNEIQGSIDLEKGSLMKLGLFHLDDGDRLLIVVHHLVMDGVSWRILFEDIQALYDRYKKGEKPVLPSKTDSYKLWSEKLSVYADSETFLKEKTYWNRLESNIVPGIKTDFEVEENEVKDTRSKSFRLGEEETELLSTKVNKAFNTEINDILLTALGLGVKKTFGLGRVLIALEGHGREEILEDVDISRTVGWFTSIYPVLIDTVFESDPGRQIKETKEALRRIPNKGIGYGILKYLTGVENKKEIQFQLKPHIGFNYLGQFHADVKQKSHFEIAGEFVGNMQSLDNRRAYVLNINGMMANQRLSMTFSYKETHFNPGTIVTLMDNFESELKNLIAFCCSREKIEFTPSDLTYKELSIENLEKLAGQYPIEDIYMLSPMQEGKLFYTFYNRSSAGGGVQLNTRFSGDLDVMLFERSMNEVFKRYDILRALFIYEGVKEPIQIILKERRVDFIYEDIRKKIENGKIKSVIDDFSRRDRMRSFDLRKDVLLRVTVLQTGDREYEVIWSFHHILMDGWCLGIVFGDFLEIYNSLRENRPPGLKNVQPYKKYIQWLMRQDYKEPGTYWKKYLDGYDKETGIPKIKGIEKDQKDYRYEGVVVLLDKDKTAKLQSLAEGSRVTLNTIVQAIWAIILGKYNRKEDVVFGAVVSGRPPEIPGVELMVGLFINTIPVRFSWEKETTFKEFVYRVQKRAVDSEPYHHYPLARIQSGSILARNLLDHILVFENFPLSERVEGVTTSTSKKAFDVKMVGEHTQPDYNFHVVIQPGASLIFEFRFNALVYDIKFVENLGFNVEEVADAIIDNNDIRLEDIRISDKRPKAKAPERELYTEDFGF